MAGIVVRFVPTVNLTCAIPIPSKWRDTLCGVKAKIRVVQGSLHQSHSPLDALPRKT